MLRELMFVGGQVAELLVTDASVVRMRPTDDVDVIAAPNAVKSTQWMSS